MIINVMKMKAMTNINGDKWKQHKHLLITQTDTYRWWCLGKKFNITTSHILQIFREKV